MLRSTAFYIAANASDSARSEARQAVVEARREGARAAVEAISRDASARLLQALTDASDSSHHRYDPAQREFVTEAGVHWHTPGSLAVYTLLGENNPELAKALDQLMEFGISRHDAHNEEQLRAQKQREQTLTEIAEREIRGDQDG